MRPGTLIDGSGGGKRMVQRSGGYDATVVSGQVACGNGEATDALPGRFVRGARP